MDKAMHKKWVLVADGHRARVFEVDVTSAALIELDDFLNPEARMAEHELATDARGRFSGKGKHAQSRPAEPNTTALKHSDELFCKKIASHLEQHYDKHDYSEISIVAAPAFLGMLRKKIPKKIQKIIREEICKDVTSMTPPKMHTYLKEHLH